ncbi:MAG: c-type cytochrome biogenesis protein CcsB [Actinomycetota bacterium]|nr:c-type cytochrome biogenesis protein CcsB [Actinomycetota bacterium]
MHVNTALAALSNGLMLAALAGYSLAVLAFAGDFAYGRPARTGTRAARARAPELTGVAVPGAGGPGLGRPGGADRPAGAAGAQDPAAPPARSRPLSQAGPWARAAVTLTIAGAAAHVAGVLARGLAAHRVPWGDMYEFVTALACVAVLFFLVVMFRYRAWSLGLFVIGAVVAALGVAETVIYTPAGPLAPALQSYWLAIHVTAMTLATGIFLVAAVLGVVYLAADRNARRVAAGRPAGGITRRLPGPGALDRLAYRTVVFAFPVWTFGIMAGAIWADQAWGRYWGWDPVETWAFITWVVYACFLHARVTAGWRGRRAAWIQLTGFGCLVFNVIGVQVFLTGLHSYAGLN